MYPFYFFPENVYPTICEKKFEGFPQLDYQGQLEQAQIMAHMKLPASMQFKMKSVPPWIKVDIK